MTPLHITVNLDRNPWRDIDEYATYAQVTRIGLAPSGTPTVVFMVVGDDGATYMATTTYRLFRMAARVFAATPTALLMEEEEDE